MHSKALVSLVVIEDNILVSLVVIEDTILYGTLQSGEELALRDPLPFPLYLVLRHTRYV